MSEERKAQDTDPRLDTPSEANREKHINFREVEEESSGTLGFNNNASKDREKEWQEGLEEGRRAKENE